LLKWSYTQHPAQSQQQQQPMAAAAKRARVEEDEEEEEDDSPAEEELDLDTLKVYSTPDILICGNCRYLSIEMSFLTSSQWSYRKRKYLNNRISFIKISFSHKKRQKLTQNSFDTDQFSLHLTG
jgi:hypothetical protein